MNERQQMGFETAADQRVQISMRDWDALRRAIWRSSMGWEAVMRSASDILQRCRHVEGCPGQHDETVSCSGRPPSFENPNAPQEAACPDRETRMDALVIMTAARMYSPTDARRPANDPFIAPSREYYSEILAALVVAQAQLEALRAAGVEIPEPPSKGGTLALPPTKLPQLQPSTQPPQPSSSEEAP